MSNLIPGLSGYSIKPPPDPVPDPVPCGTCGHTEIKRWNNQTWDLVDADGRTIYSGYRSLADVEVAMQHRIADDHVNAIIDDVTAQFLAVVETYLQGRITEPLTVGDKRKVEQAARRGLAEILHTQNSRRLTRIQKAKEGTKKLDGTCTCDGDTPPTPATCMVHGITRA